MIMATCPHADRLIPRLHDNELQNPLRREIVAHMATCVTCTRTFSLLEREQELFNHAIEDQVESVDFANFWQAVEMKLTDVPPARTAQLRLWYESWRPTWTFPVPAWAVAILLVSFVSGQVYFNDSLRRWANPTREAPGPLITKKIDTPSAPTLDPHETPPAVLVGGGDPPSVRQSDETNNETRIESFYASDTVAIRINHTDNSTVIWVGDGASDFPQ